MKAIVRKMRSEDIEEMVLVFDQVATAHQGYISYSELQEGVAFDSKTLSPHRFEVWREEFTREFKDYPEGQLVAVDAETGKVVGFQVVDKVEGKYTRYGILEDFCVLPAYRGGGIGRQLFAGAINQLRADGITRIFYESGYENHSFHEWSAKWGFKPISIVFMADQE